MNNEYDGIDKFTEAQTIFNNKILGRRNNPATNNEREMMGENTATAIFMVEATTHTLGMIMHANEEVEYQLGFTKDEVIGKNITCIMPNSIAFHHQKFLQRYLDTGKQRMVDKLMEQFPVTKQGYIRLMHLLIKVHTQINGRVLFIGLLQKTKDLSIFDEPKGDYAKLPKNYILTDQAGYIMNVSEGLYYELGLHPILFRNSE